MHFFGSIDTIAQGSERDAAMKNGMLFEICDAIYGLFTPTVWEVIYVICVALLLSEYWKLLGWFLK
ncbi:MAG: hypothetical protein UY70_C0035G0012 [Candidatus Kaiserbacteria bacterium GW2011_GWB1_52_6]|uniref:Uncharacterized protein n=3 Tax=Candidatus Kaiseribacteriota TaxID=1752734 RepID=A0A0G1XFI3_9BACT|nr:MAG: hypothetical protein UY67_C0037G0001 [Candidatus Kaiserbacteria bacterium GW2011_GWA2_52_12]KKW26155.1 MAG: hypothetical protein UY70_C0035G0012 [Candidatus Kaiserbacteria bacterium GW2011_GWB1_52_6]KKW29650.1 MAG: hypothetical protein UY74_C0067G0011 [Candidatus Kaiserbacteria bacterium GW2011_GWC2_52_8b]